MGFVSGLSRRQSRCFFSYANIAPFRLHRPRRRNLRKTAACSPFKSGSSSASFSPNGFLSLPLLRPLFSKGIVALFHCMPFFGPFSPRRSTFPEPPALPVDFSMQKAMPFAVPKPRTGPPGTQSKRSCGSPCSLFGGAPPNAAHAFCAQHAKRGARPPSRPIRRAASRA